MRKLSLVIATLCIAIASTSTSAGAKNISVTPAGVATVKKAIAAQKGHVVVVNFWATWCVPCVQEFPDLVRLQQRHRGEGLVVMAVSADMKKDIKAKVSPFLTRQHADFPQFLQVSADPEDFINAFDPSWQGDLPRTFVYDKRGRLVKVLSGPQSRHAFEAAVKPLL
jgi:thiol-disulfide isomerase/thioredoxin